MTTPSSEAPLLILAATALELGPLLAALTPPRRVTAGEWPALRTGDLAGHSVVLAETGIGGASAAAATGVLVERHAPRACLCVGIAGAYPHPDADPGSAVGSEVGAVALGSAVCAAEEVLLDAGVRYEGGMEGLDSVPLPLVPGDPPVYERLATDDAWTTLLAEACGRDPVPFATSDGLSGDAATARARARRSGAAVESMEGAAIALACLRLGLPYAELRGISNLAGVRDKGAWRIEDAVNSACDALLRALAALPA